MAYSPKLHEEEIKNKVAHDVFGAFDCTRIFGAVDFCVAVKEDGPTLWETESLLWAEAKAGIRPDLAPLFAQLVLTIGKAKTHEKHSPPPFLGAFDCEKIAFLPYHAVVDFFAVNDFDWTVTPSDPSTREFKLLQDRVRPLLAKEGVVFRFAEAKELAAFVRKNFVAGRDETARLSVTRNNFVFVWNRWREAVMPSIAVDWETAKKRGILDADFFLADLLSKDNATLVEKLYVVLRGNHYELDRSLDELGLFTFKRAEFNDNQSAHTAFWNRYRRPPRREFWHWIAERRDLLVPQDVRERKGSYFTPRIWVEKAQEAIAEALGENWQDEYDIWDCAAGTGNLLVGLSDKYKIWASTLDQADVDVMHERIKNGANLLDSHVFRFDFLNDGFDKLPEGLRKIVMDPKQRKKLVVFINPPYAEAGSARLKKSKKGVSNETAIHKSCAMSLAAFAKRELFAQFLARIYTDIPGCIIGEFSKLKHLNGPYFRPFRDGFLAKILSGFVVPADTFDNVKGQFPIGFMLWDTAVKERFEQLEFKAFDRTGAALSPRCILSYDGLPLLNDWMRPTWKVATPAETIGWMVCNGNDYQHQSEIVILSKRSNATSTFFKPVTQTNVLQSCIYLAVRHCMVADWLNDRDQFLWPEDSWKADEEFQLDCLAYTLFHGQNRISCKAGTNHWIPFPEAEVGAKDAFSSHFMSEFLEKYLAGKVDAGEEQLLDFGGAKPSRRGARKFSPEAKAVFDAGRELWRYYHAQPKALPDAAFYDIRAHFQGFNPAGRMNPDSPDAGYTERIASLRAAMKALAARLAPKVREHGFLR